MAPEITRPSGRVNAAKYLKNSKYAGSNNIPGEMLKSGEDDMTISQLYMCNKILSDGEWPAEWTKSILIPMQKRPVGSVATTGRSVTTKPTPAK